MLGDGTLAVKTDVTGDAGYLLSRVEVRPLCVVSFGRGRSVRMKQSEVGKVIEDMTATYREKP